MNIKKGARVIIDDGELYDRASRFTLNASHGFNCAFFTVCWEITFLNNTGLALPSVQ